MNKYDICMEIGDTPEIVSAIAVGRDEAYMDVRNRYPSAKYLEVIEVYYKIKITEHSIHETTEWVKGLDERDALHEAAARAVSYPMSGKPQVTHRTVDSVA